MPTSLPLLARLSRLSRPPERAGDGALPPERARSRTSAFVYGNTTALGAVLAADPVAEPGRAALVVAVTALTTFVAHVLADAVAAPLGAGDDPGGAAAHLREEVRDAGPVATSGAVPVVLLLLALAGALPGEVVQLVAVGVLVVRLAAVTVVVARLTGHRADPQVRWGGLLLAALAVAVAAAKAAFGH